MGMSGDQTFINPRTNRLRSGWRALIFIAVLLLPRLFLSFLIRQTGERTDAVFDLSFGMIFSYAAMIGWVVAVSWLCLKFLENLRLGSLGYRLHAGWWRDVLAGCGISAAMICGVVLIQALGGGTRVMANPLWWRASAIDTSGLRAMALEIAMALLMLVLAGAFEELIYRGYAFQTMLRGAPAAVPIALLSLLFALGHWENPGRTLFSTVNTVLAGIWLATAYLKTRSLWFPTALHFTWNWTMGAVFGIPVSGLLIPQHPLLLSTPGHHFWLTGGSYGSEGGAAATIVIIISTFIIWRMKSLGIAPEMQKSQNDETGEDLSLKLSP